MADTGGFRIGLQHPLEKHILKTFEIDRAALERMAFFLLAHVLVDTRLIATAMFKKVSEGGGLPLPEIERIACEVSRGTFGRHLKAVRHLIPSRCVAIAEKLNDARNDLLHWTPDRFSGPRYDGQDVSAEAGFQACMNDALQFIQTVPLNMNRLQ